jgi:hypothetical protein
MSVIMTIVPERQHQGYYNVRETAKLLNLKYQTLGENIRRGSIPRPSHLIGRRYYFTACEVEKLAEYFAAQKRYKEYQER